MSSAGAPTYGSKHMHADRTGTHTMRADALREQIEAALGDRFAGALRQAPGQVRETMPTGIAELDAMLSGGLPIGAVTELVGPLSSGRTGVALRTMAAAMREGSMCAWVDASDAFDPESAAANGVCLEQLLWVRCGVSTAPVGCQTAQTGSNQVRQPQHAGGPPQARAGQHPRDEVRGLDTAVGELLRPGAIADTRRNRSIGTPGAPNRPLLQALTGSRGISPQGLNKARVSQTFHPVPRDEQVSSDRQPKRGREANAALKQSALPVAPVQAPAAAKPWSRLDQALRAADLLLQAGGFRVLVLDLGSITPEHALRIPLATWFRFRAAADAHRTVLLALTQISCARSSAGLVVCFSQLEAQSTAAGAWLNPELKPAGQHAVRAVAGNEPKLLTSIRYSALPLRQRFTPSPQTISIDQQATRPRPPATWQFCAYALREQTA